MTPPTPRRSSAADGNAKAKRYMRMVPNGTADLGDLRAMPTNPCTAAHNQVSTVNENPRTPCRVGCGTVAVPHTATSPSAWREVRAACVAACNQRPQGTRHFRTCTFTVRVQCGLPP